MMAESTTRNFANSEIASPSTQRIRPLLFAIHNVAWSTYYVISKFIKPPSHSSNIAENLDSLDFLNLIPIARSNPHVSSRK